MKNKKMILICILLFTSMIFLSALATANLADMDVVTENKYLALYVNEEFAEIAIKDKENQHIWYSNPPDREDDPIVSGARNRNLLNSQLTLEHYGPDGRTTFMNSYADSIQENQVEFMKIENGIRIEYLLGEQWSDSQYRPGFITREILDEIASYAPESLGLFEDGIERDDLYDEYTEVRLEKLGDRERLDLSGIDYEETLGEYTIVEINEDGESIMSSDVIYEVFDIYRAHREDIERNSDIRLEDLKPLIDNSAFYATARVGFVRSAIEGLFMEAGLTPDITNEAHIKFNLDPQIPNPMTFTVPLEYKIDGRDLLVRIITGEINFPFLEGVTRTRRGSWAWTVRYYQSLPHTIELLPFFGAAGLDQEGYMFVPDGSGSLIYLNNEKTGESSYLGRVYGDDPGKEPVETSDRGRIQDIILPVFGLKEEDKSFLAIIEKGAAFASIHATIAERRNAYNYIYPSFNISYASNKSFEFGDIGTMGVNAYSERLPETDIVLRYKFFSGKDADYVGMANKYREYLIEKNNLEINEPEEKDIPLNIDIIGSVPINRPVLGISRKVEFPFTTYKQAQEMIESLMENNINQFNIKYSGWLSGSIYNDFPDSVNRISDLGNNEEFTSFIEFTKNHNIGLYPAVEFLNVYDYNWRNNFTSRKHASRYLSNQVGYKLNYNPASFQYEREDAPILISTDHLEYVMGSFIDDFSNYQIDGLSLNYMGSQLHSNNYRDDVKMIDRQQAADYISENLQKYSDSGYDIMVSGGNSYVLPYVSHVINMPISSSKRYFTDESIPFAQIALRGLVNYSGGPINHAKNIKEIILKSIEVGASPFFQLGYENQSLLKESQFHDFHSLEFANWSEELIRIYHEANDVLKYVYNQPIVGHKQVKDNVFVTSYKNGKSIIVNYNKNKIEYNDYIVEGKFYKMVEGDIL